MLLRRRFVSGLAFPFLSACRKSGQRLIAVVPKSSAHLFFVTVHAGVDAAAKEFAVRISWNGPNDETDHNRQIQIVDAFIAQRVDGMAISATDENALAAPVERAIQAGIPVTIFDSGVAVKGYVSWIATDNAAAGTEAARRLGALLERKGKVGMVMQKPGGTSTVLRERAFERTMAREFPNITIAARQYGMADAAKSRAAAENILTAHPDLAGVFASSEAASLGTIQAIRSRGLSEKIRLITFDTSDSHLQALRDGTIDVMMVQDAFRLGYEAVKSLSDKLNGLTPLHHVDVLARAIVREDLGKPGVRELLTSRRPGT